MANITSYNVDNYWQKTTSFRVFDSRVRISLFQTNMYHMFPLTLILELNDRKIIFKSLKSINNKIGILKQKI